MTILGDWSIAEEIDLIAAKDVETQRVIDAFKVFSPTWIKKDGKAFADWMVDWGNFWNRWRDARQGAEREILAAKANFLVPNTHIAAGYYKPILRAFTVTEGHWQKGDFIDLANRLRAAGAQIEGGAVPQPRPGTDADLNLYKLSDKVLKDLGLPTTDDEKDKAKKTGWVLGIIGGILALVTLGLVKK